MTRDLAIGLVESLDIWAEEPDNVAGDPQGVTRAIRLREALRAHSGGGFACPPDLRADLRGELVNEIDKYEDDQSAARYVRDARRCLRDLERPA